MLQDDGSITEIPLEQLRVGQKIIVKPGEKVAADGKVLEGETTVNEALVTGEARAVAKHAGDKVVGGSLNGSGSITVEVTGTGESGFLAQVMHMVEGAQQEKSHAEALSDKVAGLLFYVALAAGIIAFIVWLTLTGSVNTALERMVTVLIIACPHALGLAVPLVVARSTSLGAQHGLLIRKRQALEAAARVDTVLMDKTGTLTEGRFSVLDITAFTEKYDKDALLRLLSGLEQHSSHPLSVGILNKAKELGLAVPEAENVQNIPGAGLSGIVEGKKALIASAAYLKANSIAVDMNRLHDNIARGDTLSFLVIDGICVGCVAQGDQVKKEAGRLISELKAMAIRPVMLTGDNADAARMVAGRLGIDDVQAELRPEDKAAVVSSYRRENRIVMMVGDGVNDAPSLAGADVGVAIGAGTDVAIDSADIILVRSDPSDIPGIIHLAKNTMRKMVQNLWWGAGYNIIAIPLAAGVLAHWGIVLSPALGVILMSCSTVIVAVNALRLKME